jgi:ribose transport system ATP-binding protein
MVGRKIEDVFPDVTAPTDQGAITVDGLSSAEGSFSDVSFTVNKGEIFGIAGIVGAGRTELVRAIAGADPVSAGTVTVEGRQLKPGSSRDAIDAGVVLVPEDRKGQGVVLDMSIADNVALTNLDSVASSGGFISPRRVHKVAAEACRILTVKGRVEQPVGTLSGGNQQKVVIAKWLERKPKVVILDEPTRGIDVGARESIYDVIVGLAAQGVAVIVVSSELEEVLGLSHRVMVLARGKQMGVLDREEATDVAVMHLATA